MTGRSRIGLFSDRFCVGRPMTWSRTIETNTTVLLVGASNDDTPEVMVIQAELAESRVFKATTTPVATTSAAHTGGKRARV